MRRALAGVAAVSLQVAGTLPALAQTLPGVAGTPTPVPTASVPALNATPATPAPQATPNFRPAPAPPPAASATPYAAPGGRAGSDVRREDRTPATALDVVGAVRYALAHTPSLLAQRATIANLDATYNQRRAVEYPSLTGQLQNQLQRTSSTAGNLAQFGLSPQTAFSQNTASVGSQYQLYNGGQTLSVEQAKRQVDAARFQLRRDEETVAADVAADAFQLAALRQTVVLDTNDLRYQQLLLAAARASERVGRVAGVDVLRAQVAVTRSQSALIGAQTNEANAREALGVRIGATPRTVFAIPGTIPEPPLPPQSPDALVALAQALRPDVLSALANLQAARLTDAAVDNDLRPAVQVSGAFGSQVSPTSLVQQQQSIDAQNAAAIAQYNLMKMLFPNTLPPTLAGPVSRNVPGFYQFGVTSTFSLPFYDYGVRAANHHAARAQITAADATFANTLDFVDADVRANLRTATTNATQLALAKQSAQLGRESARISQLQYRNGLISFTDATQTEQTALQAENDLIGARVNYVTQIVRFRLSLGPPDTAAAADLRGP